MDKPSPPIHVAEDIDAMLARYYPQCEPVAVIGLACRFAQADDSEAFWRNLLEGRECSHRFTRQELLDAGLDPATVDAPNFVPVGSVIRNADAFDATLFGYSRQEAESIDPQQRLFLQIVWHALEHAGYAPRETPHKTGVFAAARISTYPGREPLRLTEVAQVKNLQSLMGNDKDYIATRAAYKLNLRGPALSVQTACSSSLVAVHLACESLRSGECDMAVAGGVAVSFPQQTGYLHQPGMIFSPDGHCRPFDADAQGTFAGNGVGAVALRRLADALRDGDPVIAVLRGSAVNNDGDQKAGYAAPSVAGQRAAISEALMLANIDSRQIGLIEAHGTGTPLGDPIELAALRSVFHHGGEGPHCALGSVKSNLGHLDTAAGIASLIKAVLTVERGTIPPSLHFRRANPALDLENSPFHVPTTAQPWSDASRVAGVSSFGIGGTNCHMIVAALPPELRAAELETEPENGALLLSAASEASLRRLAGAYAQALHEEPVADLIHTALHGRQLDLSFRLAAPLCAETAAALETCANGEDDILVQLGHGEAGKQAWLFSGQGSHWTGMGRTMYRHSPAFAACLDRCSAACGDRLDPPLREAMFDERGQRLEGMDYAQPAIVAFALAMAAHWQARGLKPDMVLGHSVGEYAAAVVAGHYEIEQIMPLVRLRGALMQRCKGGAMLAAFGGEAELLPLAEAWHLDLAAYNGARHLVFSGPVAGIEAFAAALAARAIRHRRLAVTGAAHSSLLDPVLDEYQRAASGLRATPGRVPLISTLLGEPIDAATLNTADYWRRHMREPVRYTQALGKALDMGANICLELGPDAPLTGIGQRETPDAVRWVASARRHHPAPTVLRQALLQLYAAGVKLPWRELLSGAGHRRHAPLYPFDNHRYWREAVPISSASTAGSVDPVYAAGRRVAIAAAAELDLPRLHALYDCATQLHATYVDAMVRRCIGARFEQGASAFEMLRAGRLLPRYRQLLIRLLNACVEDGYYHCEQGRYAPAREVPHARRGTLLEALRGCCEGLDPIADTVARAGEQLYAMMSGHVEPVAVIFPDGASDGVEVLYQEFSFGRYFNRIAAGVMAGLMRERHAAGAGRPFRILEVGGGTGGTTAWLLPELTGQTALRYDFTDISAIFTRRAEAKFASYDFLAYRQLDLQKDAQTQGFETGGYDLIVAANVIHATQHIGRTLENLRSLLKPGGRLLMREITRPMRLFDFVFGPLVLPLHDEAARSGELFLSTTHWEAQCRAAGFARIDWLPEDGTATAQISEHILLAAVSGPASAAGWVPAFGEPHPLLGHPLTGDGHYLADWSDCAGQELRWQERLQQASAELSRRHGNGRSLPAANAPAIAPVWLAQVRLRWQAEPFGAGRAIVEGQNGQGPWQPLADASARNDSLPVQPAPGTHYDWVWQAIEPVALPAGGFELINAPPAAGQVLEQAGLAAGSDTAQWLLLRLPEEASLDALAAAVLAVLADAARRPLLVVTRAAWMLDQDSRASAAHRAIWGLLRVAAAEQPARRIAALDLAATAPWSDLLPGLGAVGGGAHWIAVRNGRALAPHLAVQEHPAPTLPAQGLPADGWHVVTGAFGGLGRLSVSWLLRHGARRVALLAPRAHDDWPRWQQTLAEYGDGCVRWLPCDVADPIQLAAALDELQADGGIAGAIHAAGLLDDTPLATLDVTRLAPLLAVKADAAHRLRDRLRKHGGRYLLLYSSAAAALGTVGQGAHALASAYLDGLAQESCAEHAPRTIAIAWGAWGEAGRAARAGMREKLAAVGMDTLSNAEGLWHLEQAVMRGAAYRLAMRVIPGRLDAAHSELLRKVAPVPAKAAAAARHAVAPFAGDVSDPQAVAGWLSARIAAQLRLEDPSKLTPRRDLLQLGLDSLLFLELSSDIQHLLGIRLNAEQAYRDLTVDGLSRLITASAAQADTGGACTEASLRPDPVNRFEPFPLTPIQHAYWLGRTDLIDYGGVACHVLFEWDKRGDQLDLARLEQAWNALVRRHDMLRMTVGADGRQRILPETPAYRVQRRDLRALTPQQRERALDETRHELSYRVLPADRWPLFELIASEWDARHYRLHMHLDLLLFDVQSFKVMMDDLARAYRGEPLEPLELSFRDYVLAEQAQRDTPAWRESWCYWQDVLPELPPAPRLPLAKARPAARPRVATYQAHLAREPWETLKRTWRTWGVTPSAALLTLFACTLEAWSRQPDFTLNLTFFNRRPDHPQVPELIGDFTSVLLVDFALGQARPLREIIERTQQRLWQRLTHSRINGVELMRELGRGRLQSPQPLMPVVFTSLLGMSLDGLSIDQAMTGLLGDPVHVFTQTPQVWLDHQVMEIDGELIFNWYCMDDVLVDQTAQTMFEDYAALLRGLAAQPARMEAPGPARRHAEGAPEDVPRRAWPMPDWPASLPDPRDIEDALRLDPAIRQAEASTADGGVLTVTLVADDRHAAAGPPAADLDTTDLPMLDETQLAEVEAAWQWLEGRALAGIAATLRRHGLFTCDEQRHDADEVQARLRALPQYSRLVRQWLALLCTRGWLRREDRAYARVRPLEDLSGPPGAPPPAAWSRRLDAYLATCLARHDALFDGSQPALALLFGEDDEVTRSLYRDNPVSDCLNRSAAQLARRIAADSAGLRVLEVGAGTAATTRRLLPALAGRLHSYRFTDVSTLFLDDARRAFADLPAMEYARLDINQQVDFDAHPPAGYDLVVAVNVLHDASHVVRSLRRLGRLLKTGGYLLLIEATERDSALQMASIGFIESLNGYQDFRLADDKPMLDLPRWRGALREAGFGVTLTWPAQEHTPLRQHLVLARAEQVARLDVLAVEQRLRAILPSLPPLRLRQCERLEAAGEATSSVTMPATAPPPPSTRDEATQLALEKCVASIWQDLLSQPVRHDSDFFQSGGDSLIATRMIAQLKRRGLPSASLQNLFAQPTLGMFCASLEAPEQAASNPQLLAKGRRSESLFAFHASDGELDAYRPLARRLDAQVFGLHAGDALQAASLDELAARYVAAIRGQQPRGPYRLLGWSYGSFLAAEAAHILHGYDEVVELILLDPVCRDDFRYASQSELLHLLAHGRVEVPLPKDFDRFDADTQLAHFMRNAATAGALTRLPEPAQARNWLQRIGHLLDLLARHRPPAPLPTPTLWLSAARRPADWQPAERDWLAWAAHAERHTLDADHWQLVLDEACTRRVAALINPWRQRRRLKETA